MYNHLDNEKKIGSLDFGTSAFGFVLGILRFLPEFKLERVVAIANSKLFLFSLFLFVCGEFRFLNLYFRLVLIK